MSLGKDEAARLLGMKVEEIVAINRRGRVYDVTTHDGVCTEIDGDTLTTRQGDGDVTVAEATEDGPQLVDGGADGQAGVVAEAMALPVDDGRADVRVVDEELFAAADPEDLAELGLARLGGPVRADAPPPHPVLDGDRNEREMLVGFHGGPGEKSADEGLAKAIAGNAKDVTNWVGSDPERAQRAIDAEKARTSTPRVTLLHDLDKIAKAGKS